MEGLYNSRGGVGRGVLDKESYSTSKGAQGQRCPGNGAYLTSKMHIVNILIVIKNQFIILIAKNYESDLTSGNNQYFFSI
jgi:hypothetical protein